MRSTTFLFYMGLVFTSSLQAQNLSCAKLQETPIPGTGCCFGLKLNTVSNLCEDPIKDESLTYCTVTSDCGAAQPGMGKGCFRMSEDDLFSADVKSAEGFIPQSDAQDKVDEDRDKNPNEEPLRDGESCVRSSDCDSYYCDPVAKKCSEKRICRWGDMGEAVEPGVRCDEGLVVNGQGLCDLSEEDKKFYYMGLIEGNVNVETKNKCDLREYQNDPQMKEIRDKSIVSMKTLRAMEWLFSTSGLDESQECLKLLPFLRDEMATKFAAERKKILANFNVEMSQVEKDNLTLQNAKEDSEQMVSIHGEAIREKDLATRRTSGYDAMKIMWRRNLLFQAYEKAMSEIVKTAATKVGGLAEEMGKWTDKSKKWKVGDKEWTAKTAGKCRGSKAKTLKKRWSNFYQVNGSSSENSAVINRAPVLDYLALVSGQSQDKVKATLEKGPKTTKFSNYFLIDPLMPGEKGKVSFEQFGSGKKNKRKLNANAYPEIRKKFREDLKAYYKSLKGTSTSENFVFEPEILSVEARDCIDKPDGQKCDQFETFLDEMTDIAFAQFLAYSIHSKNSYKRFFTKGNNMRRQLLAKYESDMQNIVKYYDAMSVARDEQTKCLETTINQVVETILDDGPGIVEGSRNFDPALTTSGAESGSNIGEARLGAQNPGARSNSGSEITRLGTASTGPRREVEALKVSRNVRTVFTPNLQTGTLISSGQLTRQETINAATKITGGSGDVTAGDYTKQFATRLRAMKDTNSKAKLGGANLAAREGEVSGALRNLSQTSGASPVAPRSSQIASSGVNGTAELEVIPQALPSTSGVVVSEKPAINLAAPGSASTVTDQSPGSYGGSTATESSRSGITDQDQELIEANYQRSKGDYASQDEDPLFSKVSKAYVRNLGKILIRKKKVEE